jgi:hypothetical protein
VLHFRAASKFLRLTLRGLFAAARADNIQHCDTFRGLIFSTSAFAFLVAETFLDSQPPERANRPYTKRTARPSTHVVTHPNLDRAVSIRFTRIRIVFPAQSL